MWRRTGRFAPSALHFPCKVLETILSWRCSADRWTRRGACSVSGELAGEFLFCRAGRQSSWSTFRRCLRTRKNVECKQSKSVWDYLKYLNEIWRGHKSDKHAQPIAVMPSADNYAWLSFFNLHDVRKSKKRWRCFVILLFCYLHEIFFVVFALRWSMNEIIVRGFVLGSRSSMASLTYLSAPLRLGLYK